MTETVADIVRVLFTSEGAENVSRAFEGVAAKMARFEKTSTQTTASGVRERVRAAQTERKEREAVYAAMFKQIDAQEKAASKSADKAARDRGKAEAAAARERLREEENLARSRQRILDNSARYAGRVAEQQATAEIRAAERSARERTRIGERSARERGAMGRALGGHVGGATSRVMGGVGMLAAGALAIGGGAGFADSIRGDMQAEKAAIGLVNSLPADAGHIKAGTVLGQAKAIQAFANIDKTQALEGMRAYIAKTGDASLLKEGDPTTRDIAKLSKATDSNFADLMGTAGILRAQNANLSPEKMMETLRVVAAQGQKGAIELSDLANMAGRVTASSAMYAGDQTTTQRKLLGLAQIVYPTAGSAEESATAVTRLGSDALAHTSNLRAAGIDAVDKKTGRLKDADEIITKVLGVTGGNLGKIQELGFGERSMKVFESLAPKYQDAYAGAKGSGAERTKEAEGKIGGIIASLTGAKMGQGEVDEKFAGALAAKAEKFDAAMNRIREVLAERGVPVFEKFVNTLADHQGDIDRVVTGLASLAEWLMTNPAEGIGAMMLATLTKDLAGAGIGVMLKDTLANILTKGAAGGHPMTLTGAVTMAAGVVTIMAAKQAVDDTLGGQVAGQRRAGEIMSMISHVNELPPEQRRKRMAEITGELDSAKATGGLKAANYDPAALAIDSVAGAITGDKKGIFNSHEAVEKGAFSEELIKNMEKFNAEIRKANESFGAGSSGGGSLANSAHPARSGPPVDSHGK